MEYRRGRISQEYRRWGTAMCRLNSDQLQCGWDGGCGWGLALEMTGGQRAELERLARSHTAPAPEVRQAKALLWAAAEGPAAVGRIRAGRGRPVVLGDDVVEAIVLTRCTRCPRTALACWSTRSMAARYGIARTWWPGYGRHRIRPWKVETSPTGTTTPSPSSGPNPPKRSSTKSPADKPLSSGHQIRDTPLARGQSPDRRPAYVVTDRVDVRPREVRFRAKARRQAGHGRPQPHRPPQ